jgi:RNA polymerase sigma-70 factor (ECF subfamily)
VNAARVAVVGRTRVAKYVAKIAPPFWAGVTLNVINANGRASLLMSRGGEVVAFATVVASKRRIDQILWVMRPSKLAALARALRAPARQ